MADNINPWKYVQAGDVSNNPYFKKSTDITDATSETQDTTTSDSNDAVHELLTGRYEISDRFDTYAKGVDFIRSMPITKNTTQPIFSKSDGSKVYRPLTMLESLEVMINDYNTLFDKDGKTRTIEDRERLFSNYKFTCSGVAYKKGGKEIKIIQQSTSLITIKEDHNTASLDIDYASTIGDKLNISKAAYNKSMSKSDVIEHPAWIASVGDTTHGRKVLKDYTKIVFDMLDTKKKGTQGMGFYILNSPDKDQLRALCVNDIDNCSYAIGYNNLNNFARFLLVAPSKKILHTK